MKIKKWVAFPDKYRAALILTLICQTALSQLEKPSVFLSQYEMTASGGQVYDEFYWFNTNLASLTKTGVSFPTTGSYRFDLSAYKVAGSPTINVLIDGVSKGTITYTSTAIELKSLFISSITSGTHTVAIQLSNFSSGTNHIRVGLLYFTQTALTTPYVYPALAPKNLPVGLLTKEDFGGGKLRGFNLGSNGTNGSGEPITSMTAMKATGANIARCFVQIERLSGDTYTFKSGELTKLATTVSRGTSLGFYVVPVLYHSPSLNTDYWGTTASQIARRASIVSLWQTLATTYNGNTTIAAYDLINEPRSNFNYAEVIRWQTDMIDAIRAIDANHVIAVECISNDMFAMMLPLGYSNIIYSPHGYSSLHITHQGVSGGETVRNPYPLTTTSANLTAPWGTTQLSTQHDDVRIMSSRFHVPVFIGEFSCVNWAPASTRAGKWTSTEWTNDNITLLETEGWSWAYNDWVRGGEYIGWDPEIPSQWYATNSTFTNADPSPKPAAGSGGNMSVNGSTTAPTIVMLKGWFALNTACPTSGTTTAHTYYFSTQCGDDSRTATQARNPSTPWRTIAKLNSYFSTLTSSDSVVFNRGEEFQGNIVINKSGVYIGAYGSGDNPVITSMVNLTGWVETPIGSGIWASSSNNSLGSTVTTVTRDGGLLQLGRYPNANATWGGYLKYEGHTGTTAIIDADLTTNYAGADMVVRTKHFTTEIRKISSFSAGVLTATTAFQQTPEDNSGYFIQNDKRLLDFEGEWYYEPSTKKVYIKSATQPTNIQASTGTDLVTSTNFSSVKFRNLTFFGANNNGLQLTGGTGIDIQNCSFRYMQRAVNMEQSDALIFKNNNISNALADGLILHDGNSPTVEDNVFDSVYQYPGMGLTSYDFGGYAIKEKGPTASIQRNRITHNGYSGIRIDGDNVLVKNNLVDGFNNKMNDGGAFYTVPSTVLRTGQTIVNNIFLNGLGAIEGASSTARSTSGIYIDNNNSNNTVTGNTVYNCEYGFYSHRGNHNVVRNNTFYNNVNTGAFFNEDDSATQLIRSDVFKNNISFGRTATQLCLYLNANVYNNDIRSFGTFDSNYLCRPISEPNGINNAVGSIGATIKIRVGTTGYYSLDQYKLAYSPYEAHSVKSPKGYDTLRFIYNDQMHDSTFSMLGYQWLDAKGTRYSNFVTLAPFTSLVLIRDGLSTTNTPPSVSITAPANNANYTALASITINANASDVDGTVSSVKFYNGATLLSTDLTSPYSYNWTGVTAGTYTITAVATDNGGLVSTSLPITVIVARAKPVVTITTPANNATYTAPATINLSATATDADGTITRVDWFRNGVFIGTDASSPYTVSQSSVPVGGYTYTAWAVDNSGDSSQATVNVSVTAANVPPTASITSPLNNASYIGAQSIVINVTSSDADGTVSRVNFYDGTTWIGTDVTNPYSFTQLFSVGTHNIYVTSKDNTGDSATAGPVTITVLPVPNKKPVVVITNPSVDTGQYAPATILIDVSASDTDGTITTTHIYKDGVFAGVDNSSPYSFSFSSIPAGLYVFTVWAIDNSGDSTAASRSIYVVNPSVPKLDTLSISVTIGTILCNGGSTTVNVSGTGGLPFSDGTYHGDFGDHTETAGIKTYYIEDSLGTRDTAILAVPEPGALSATVNADTIATYLGTVNKIVTPLGGTPTYVYSKDGVTWQASNVFTLSAGSYTLRVRDSHACTTSVSFTLTQPPPSCSNCIIRGHGKKIIYK